MGLLLAVWLAGINLAAFLLMGIDKRRARLGRWRIRESVLLLTAAVGGSIGAIAGMVVFRHKTRHLKFALGLPVILLAQLILVYLIDRGGIG